MFKALSANLIITFNPDGQLPHFLFQCILSIITSANVLPPKTAAKDKPTLAKIFRAIRLKRLLSNKLLVSSANEDMVVKLPQKPTATSKVYFGSKLKAGDMTENAPKMKLPITFTTSTFTGNP